MVKRKPWQFFTIKFTADDGKHVVSSGAESQEDAIELINGMYTNVHNLQVITRENKE
jgi:hypothetical protein